MTNTTTYPIPTFTPAEIVTFNNIIIGLASTLSSLYISSKLPSTTTMGMSTIIYRTMPTVIGILIMTYLITKYSPAATTR